MTHWRDNPLAVQCEAGRVMWRNRDVVHSPAAMVHRSCSRQGTVHVRIFTLCKLHATMHVQQIMERERGT